MRAAVTTGEAVVALGARPERGEGIVTGDVVNTAARLQSAAPVGAVIVDESTMRSTESAITFEPLEPVAAKGKAEPIPVWRATHARSRVGQPEAATHTPFVGREHERTLLLETFLRAERESSVQLVTVIGEPGIGKSRLVTELRTALDDRPDLITWRHGRCLPYGEGITFWALGEIVKAEAGILESDDQHVAASKLDETVAALFADESERAWFGSRLAPLVGAGGDGAAVSREEAFTAWRRFLEAMAARRPCVLVVEDLHWADGALLEFLEHLLDWSMPVPLLLLCTARPELFERQPSWGGGKRNATTISLAPLSTEEAGRLLQVLLDRTLLPAETQAALLERAGGNPLYAEQFARMLVERGDVEGLAVPETVQALMAARLDTLRPELKALLHDAAVVGRMFWSGAVAAIGERDRDEVRRDLNELVRREFVRPVRVSSVEGEDEFSFWHALVRDVAYQQIPRSPRAEKHVAAARLGRGDGGGAARGPRRDPRLPLRPGARAHAGGGRGAAGLVASLVRFLLLAGDRAMQLDTAAAEAYYPPRARACRATTSARGRTRSRSSRRCSCSAATSRRASSAYEDGDRGAPRRIDERAAGRCDDARSPTSLWARGDVRAARRLEREAIAILERTRRGPSSCSRTAARAARDALGGRSDEAIELRRTRASRSRRELGVEDIDRAPRGAGDACVGYQGDPARLDDLREARRPRPAPRARPRHGGRDEQPRRRTSLRGPRPRSRARGTRASSSRASRGLTHHGMWQRGERLRASTTLGDWDELVARGRRGRRLGAASTAEGSSRSSRASSLRGARPSRAAIAEADEPTSTRCAASARER